MRKALAALVVIGLIGGPASAQDAAASRPLAIRAKRAITVSGAPIDDATIVIENGKITAIGARASVDVPEDADVIEAGDLVATPGFIHPASIAMSPAGTYDVSGRNNSADRYAADDLAPTWPGVKTLAKAGYTRVNVIVSNGGFAGQSVLIKPVRKLDRPIRREDVIAIRDLALCMAFEPRTTNKVFWKDTLAKVRKYREDRAAAAARGGSRAESGPASRPAGDSPSSNESRPASRPASRPGEPVQDPKITPIADLLDGKMPGILAMSSAAALLHFLPIAHETPDFKPALFLLDDAWRIVAEVKKLGVPVILQPNRVYRPDTNVELVPVRDYVDAGIAVALIPETTFVQGYEGLPFHLSELARKGIAADVLLRAVTLTPAEILGIQKEVGSLDKGKAGDVLLWSADPLSPEADLVRVIVGGETVHDERSRP
jgi:hypothetical protein